MKKKIMIKKLNEDDILEILLAHYQDQKQYKDFKNTRGLLLGEPGKDLRFIGVFVNEAANEIFHYDLEAIDREQDFNKDHSFFEKYPETYLGADKI